MIERSRGGKRVRPASAQSLPQSDNAVGTLSPACGIRHQACKRLRTDRGAIRWPLLSSAGAAAEAAEIERSAGLGSGAGKPPPAKGLRADHCADLVAVDIDVARADLVEHLLHARVNPRVEPDRKSTRLNSSHVKISYAVF